MKYEPPRIGSFGVVFDRIEVIGAEVFVTLAPAFFSVPAKWREPILDLVLRDQARSDPARRCLRLRDPLGRDLGRFCHDPSSAHAGEAGDALVDHTSPAVPESIRDARFSSDTAGTGMRESEAVDVGIEFARIASSTGNAARRAVLSFPALLGPALRDCLLALDPARAALLVLLHLEGTQVTDSIQRLRFWCGRAGGAVDVLRDGVPATRSSWSARLAACTRKIRCRRAEDHGRALDAVLGCSTASERGHGTGPSLDVDVGGAGAAGIAFNAETRLLFIPTPLTPPVGDEFQFQMRGAGGPMRCRARVVRVRDMPSATPSAPAGFVLDIGAASSEMIASLAPVCGAMNADAMIEEARRSAPRYSVYCDVTVEPAGCAPPGLPVAQAECEHASAMPGRAVSLSIGGAFIELPRPLAAGSRVRLSFHAGEHGFFVTQATAVFATAKGMGVKFELEARAEIVLSRMIARISARPRRALVVDDEALARGMVGDALSERGFEVLEARSSEAALRLLASELYALDVVVSDLLMEGLDGSHVVNALDSARGHVEIAIVVLAGTLDPEKTRRLTECGADAVLDKQLPLARIVDAVEAVLERRAHGTMATETAPTR